MTAGLQTGSKQLMWTRVRGRFATLPGSTQEAILLSVYFLFVFARAPFLLTQGRFWAEEGCVYFQYAWTAPAWQALTAPHLGYYALYPNLCTVLAARLVPILYAPLMLTWCAVLVQMLAAYLVLDCEAFGSLKQRVLALAVLLFTAPNKEVWLNTINSQFYFLVCGILIFLSSSQRRVIFRSGVLLIAGLTGILTVYLAPFFWLRAVRDRTRGAIVEASVLTACMAVQCYVVLQFLHSGARRIYFQWQDIGPALVTRDMALPVGGRLVGTHLAYIIRQHMAPLFLVLWSGVALAGVAAFCFLISARPASGEAVPADGAYGSPSSASRRFSASRRGQSLLLLLAAVWTSCLCMYGAINSTSDLIYPTVSERYSFGSNIMLALSMVLANREFMSSKSPFVFSGRLWRFASTGLLTAVLLVGVWDYGTYMPWLMPEARPAWRLQVQAWDKDPRYRLQAWPNRKATEFTLPHKP